MSRGRQILVAGGTFSIALGIGFVMQNGDALAARFTPDGPQDSVAVQPLSEPLVVAQVTSEPQAQVIMPPHDDLATAMVLPTEEPVPSLPDTTMQLAAADPAQSDIPAFGAPTAALPDVAAQDCNATMSAEPTAGGIVRLSLDAACAPDTAAIIHHNGMMFTILTDTAGQAVVDVPALSEVSVFIAAFDDGTGAAATAMVPELATMDRAVLQWQGVDGLQLHALEFGSGYGDAGHVWSGAPRDAAVVVSGEGGFLMRLGDPAAVNPMMAEVYSFPSGQAPRDGTIVLSVEAEVTAANCGRDIAAQSLQIAPGTAPEVLDLTMAMPGCDATGELLVLHGMLHDVQLVASRN